MERQGSAKDRPGRCDGARARAGSRVPFAARQRGSARVVREGHRDASCPDESTRPTGQGGGARRERHNQVPGAFGACCHTRAGAWKPSEHGLDAGTDCLASVRGSGVDPDGVECCATSTAPLPLLLSAAAATASAFFLHASTSSSSVFFSSLVALQLSSDHCSSTRFHVTIFVMLTVFTCIQSPLLLRFSASRSPPLLRPSHWSTATGTRCTG